MTPLFLGRTHMFLNLLCPSLEYLSHVAVTVTVAHSEEEAILRNTPPPPQLLWISGITELCALEKEFIGATYHGRFPHRRMKNNRSKACAYICSCIYIYNTIFTYSLQASCESLPKKLYGLHFTPQPKQINKACFQDLDGP